MDNTTKVLLSARDPGAASHLIVLAKHLAQITDISVHFAAMEPAYTLAVSAGIKAIKVHCGEPNTQAQDLIKKLKPDFILVGLSDPDTGIDEALYQQAENIPCYTYQDFWGAINPQQSILGHKFLVLDKTARDISLSLGASEAHIVGSLAHQGLSAIRSMQKRTQFRKRIKVSNKTIGLCMQPLWHLRWYRESIKDLLLSVKNEKLLLRFHPKLSKQTQLNIRHFFNQYCANNWSIDSGSLEAFIVGVDVLLSSFSNCNYDLINHNLSFHKGINSNAMLFQNSDMRTWFQHTTQLDQHPLGLQKSTTIISNKSLLRTQLQNLQKQSVTFQQAQAARQQHNRVSATQNIVEFIKGASKNSA